MATFEDDMSGHTATTQCDKNNLTTIAGYTGYFNAAGEPANQKIVVTAGATPTGVDKFLRLTENWNAQCGMYVTALGDHGGALDVRILWRLGNLTVDGGAHSQMRMPNPRISIATPGNSIYTGLKRTASPELVTMRGGYAEGANDWTHIGGLYDVTSTYAAGEWWWSRMKATAANLWSWKTWEYGDAEPGWFAENVSRTEVTTGRIGFALHSCTRDPVDVAYYSVGTGVDLAPEPVGAGFSDAIPGVAMPAPIGGVADLALNFIEAIPGSDMPALLGGVAGLDILRDIVVTNFSDINGANWISRANLHWIWCEFDLTSEALDPLTLGASVVDAGTNAATDGSGTLTIPVNTILTSGATGTLIVFDPTGGETLIRAVAL